MFVKTVSCSLLLAFSFLMTACGGGSGSSNLSDGDESSNRSDNHPIQIKGYFALALSEGSERMRTLSGYEVELLDRRGQILGTVTTTDQGAFHFALDVSASQYPLTLKSVRNGKEYSSIIATIAAQTSVNLNEITTAIAKQFLESDAISQESLDTIAELVMSNRFGINENGAVNVPPETFVRGDFSSPSSLGNIILQTSAEVSVDLLEATKSNAPLLIQSAFLEHFTKNIRHSSNPSEAIGALRSQGQGNQLVNSLYSLVASSSAEEVAAINDSLRSHLMNHIKLLQEKISELKETLVQLSQRTASTTTSTPTTSTTPSTAVPSTTPSTTASTPTTTTTSTPTTTLIASSGVTIASTTTIASSEVTIASTTTIASSEVTIASTTTIASSGITVLDFSNGASFDLPKNTISMILMVFGNQNSSLGIRSLKDPQGNELMNSFPLKKSNKQVGYAATMIPMTTNHILAPGRWNFRPDSGYTSIKLVVRTGPKPTGAKLKIRPYLTGTKYSVSQVKDALAETKKIFGKARIRTEFDIVHTVSGSEYRAVSADFENSITSKLISRGPADRINIFFVEDILDAMAAGVTSGIPGSQWVAGPRNGVLVSIDAAVRNDGLDIKKLGKTTGHEIGHWLGLYHTSESVHSRKPNWQKYDTITDTPECPHATRGATACLPYDGKNLMFWKPYDRRSSIWNPYEGEEVLSLSPGQIEIIRKSPFSRESSPLSIFVVYSLLGEIFYSTDGSSWIRSRDNLEHIEGIAYGNGRFVTVGSGRAYYSTDDGNSWNLSRNDLGDIKGIAYGNGRFVTVGSRRAYYSTDGSSWNPSRDYIRSRSAIAYGNGRFVAVGSGRAYYSTDGSSWNPSNDDIGQMSAIAYGNGRFVAVGSGRVYYSTDGSSWNPSRDNLEHIEGIAYGNGRFVAVGSGRAYYSTDDGNSWNQSRDYINSMSIAYGNGRFVTVSWEGTSYSSDGISWHHSSGIELMERIAVSD